MTYFLQLLFVFITLLAVAWAYSSKIWWHYYNNRDRAKRLAVSTAWALLGTFFFHSLM